MTWAILFRVDDTRCLKLYGLPKIQYLTYPIKPIVEDTPLQVKTSEHFISTNQNQKINSNDKLASLDITTLYHKITLDKGLDQPAINEDLSVHIIDLSQQCYKNTYFSFHGKIYRQTEGTPLLNMPLSNHNENPQYSVQRKPTGGFLQATSCHHPLQLLTYYSQDQSPYIQKRRRTEIYNG